MILLLSYTFSYAQTTEITNGLNYLSSTQNPDGSWGGTTTGINTDFYSTAVCVETLKILNETTTQTYINGIQWLSDYPADNTGYIAWKILALGEEGIDLSADVDILLQRQNEDGGWGGYDEYTSSNFQTALVLQALRAVNSTDLNVVSYALGYLINNQNPDGGFGFYSGDESNVYMTATVLQSLISYDSTFNIQDSIDNAVAYLLTKQNPDGGFGPSTGSGSTVYETALALDALIASNSVGADKAQDIQNTINYLTSTQLPDGSWDDDPYSTALALRALSNVKPNLSITNADITFSNPAPTVGETITITAMKIWRNLNIDKYMFIC
jgi:squalene cyclase